MRLTCPNCGAQYEVPDGMIPAAGRHVQCTTCHTRWFVRGTEGAALTEDQILRRIETWSPRPRPVAVPDPAPEPAPETVSGTPAAEPEPVEAPPEPEIHAISAPEPARRSGPTKPADRPSVPRPGPLSEAAPPPVRAAPRLDLGRDAAPAPAGDAPRSRSRFGRGVLVALVLFLLALAAYRYRDDIAIRLPAAAPALQAYGGWVDDLRDDLAERFDDLRQRLDG